jgi:hypothetical protein
VEREEPFTYTLSSPVPCVATIEKVAFPPDSEANPKIPVSGAVKWAFEALDQYSIVVEFDGKLFVLRYV